MKKELKNKIRERSIQKDATILSALKQMDTIDKKLLLVFDGEHFMNLLSIGDIQRAIIMNTPLDEKINTILRKKTRIADVGWDDARIRKEMWQYRTECMPIVDDTGQLVDVYFWEDVYPSEDRYLQRFHLPVVIMAGGKGTRLQPLTNVLPKPLIPLGEKTMLEHIMDSFISEGADNFYISVNYKADMIRHYFDTLEEKKYKIDFIEENKPLGTAGSLALLKGKIDTTFFVTNCDILIRNKYAGILDYHRKNRNLITLVAALKNYPIPYGVVEIEENGLLKNFLEKPEKTYLINSGFYIMEPEVLDMIPGEKYFQITELFEKIRSQNGRIGVFPVSEKSWIDVGEWEVYLKYRSLL